MNSRLRQIVERELGKLDELSSHDQGTLSQDHLEALATLARILKDADGDDFPAPTGDLSAALAALEGTPTPVPDLGPESPTGP